MLFSRSALVSNCQTDMMSFLVLLFLLSTRISVFYELGFVSGLGLGLFSDFSRDKMTSCQFGS